MKNNRNFLTFLMVHLGRGLFLNGTPGLFYFKHCVLYWFKEKPKGRGTAKRRLNDGQEIMLQKQCVCRCACATLAVHDPAPK